MNILYVTNACSEEEYDLLFQNIKKEGLQNQKFNNLFIKGFSKNGCEISVLSSRPVFVHLHPHKWFKSKKEVVDNIKYNYIPFFNISKLRGLSTYFFIKKEIKKWIKSNSNGVIVCDILNYVLVKAISKVIKGKSVKLVSIVTDLPEMIAYKNLKRLNHHNNLIYNSDYFILLSKYMGEKINPNKKPEIIVEGFCDINMDKVDNTLKNKYDKKVVMYAGLLHGKYGIANLVKAFDQLTLEDIELHIYGTGDWEEELKQYCDKNDKIKFFGTKDNSYVVNEQLKATLLVNPRPTNEDFVYYSFPSKNMEYMASGTPMLTTNLPSIPEEYKEYCFVAKGFGVDELKSELETILSKTPKELNDFGNKAKKWVLKNKNNRVQAEKVYHWLVYQEVEKNNENNMAM